LLSTLFANSGQANFLVRSEEISQSPKYEQLKLSGKSNFSLLRDSGLIQLASSFDDVPITTISTFFITSHATPSHIVQHERVIKKIAPEIAEGTSMVYTGLCSPDYTSGRLGSDLAKYSGLNIGKQIGLAYLPLVWTNEPSEVFREKPKMLAVASGTSEGMVQETILQVFPSIRIIREIKLAETAALYAAAAQEVIQALQLELALTADKDGVDFAEILGVFRSIGKLPFSAQPLAQSAQPIASGIMSQRLRGGVIRAAKKMNNEFQQDVLRLVKRAVRKTGQPLRRSRIAILGSEWLAESSATNELPQLVKILSRKCAGVTVYSTSHDWKPSINDMRNLKVETDPMRALSKANCALVALTSFGPEGLDVRKMALEMSRPATICDLTGVMIASNVEQAGLFYTGIGRGPGVT
jgi:UDP-N-acetyl-D-mannosaminuronate dehydrogenase